MTPYNSPEKFGLTLVADVSLTDEPYEYDIAVVWYETRTGVFWFGQDSGCSCPQPFEDEGLDTLQHGSKAEAIAFLGKQNRIDPDDDQLDTQVSARLVKAIETVRAFRPEGKRS